MKNKFKLDVFDSAHEDMDKIVSYFKTYSNAGASRIRSKLREAIKRIYAQPYIGVAVRNEELSGMEFRMVIVENYLIFYRVFENESKVVIYRVLDGRRDYPSLLK